MEESASELNKTRKRRKNHAGNVSNKVKAEPRIRALFPNYKQTRLKPVTEVEPQKV